MKKYIFGILCCILLFVSCSNKDLDKKVQGSTVNESVSQPEQESGSQEIESSLIPEVSSFSTMILAEGNMVLQQDYYPLDEENLLEFQNALMFSQWREPAGYQPKGEFLSPCVIVEGENHSVMYISPANKDYVFDNTLIFIKYGKDQQYNAIYFAPGEVAQKVEALREKYKSMVGLNGLTEFDLQVPSSAS